jgi:hypothetical protein
VWDLGIYPMHLRLLWLVCMRNDEASSETIYFGNCLQCVREVDTRKHEILQYACIVDP